MKHISFGNTFKCVTLPNQNKVLPDKEVKKQDLYTAFNGDF